jgi:hypothetical protein
MASATGRNSNAPHAFLFDMPRPFSDHPKVDHSFTGQQWFRITPVLRGAASFGSDPEKAELFDLCVGCSELFRAIHIAYWIAGFKLPKKAIAPLYLWTPWTVHRAWGI